MPYLALEGVNYFYGGSTGKEGAAVVFCHGSGGSHRHWHNQLRGLSGKFNTLAVDLPGHGSSGGEPKTDIGAYSAFLHRFIRELGLEQVYLAGHSMGGAVALDYALNRPADLLGLILVGAGGRLRVAPAIMDVLRSGKELTDMASYAYGPKATPDMLEQGSREMEAIPPAVYLADFTACDNFDIMDLLPRIEIPVLIICGSEDRLTPVKYSRYLLEKLPTSELEEIEGAGHMVMLEEPDKVTRAIDIFLERTLER